MFDKIIGSETPLAWPLQFWPVIPAAFVTSVVFTLLCEKTAVKLGVVDKPDNLVKTHRKPIPYLGGVGIFLGLTAGILTALFCLPADYPPITRKWLLGIIIAGAIACVVGCIDDIVDIRPWQKVLGQVAAGIVLVAVGITPIVFSPPWPGKLLVDTIIVMIFVLGATNSLNLLDGLDGLCAGVTIICAGGMLLLAVLMGTFKNGLQGDAVRAIVCLALLGSVCGFLLFNYHPARIFMGDAGSLLLGLIMAALMILFAEKTPQFWLASVVIFGLPILDTAVAFARRIVNKRPLFVPDRGHIYDQMMDRGLSVRKTVGFCYGLTALYAVVGIIVGLLPILAAVAVCAAVVFVSALAVWKKGYLKMAGLRGEVPQNSTHHSAGHRID
ncbi:MAG: MraY family glycosyltransferase [Planctomycetota bacterium]